MVEEKIKIKKKKWVEIIAPKIFKETSLGEISLVEANLAVGRTIKANLMGLTGNFKSQNTEIGLKIVSIQDGKANTEMISYTLVPSSIRRLVRRGKEKIDYTFSCSTSDGKKVKIKVFLITRFAVKKSVLTALRKSTEQILVEELKKIKFDNFIDGLVSKKITRELSKLLAKIYPLKICEIREVKVLSAKGEVKVEEKPKEEVKKEPKETPKEDKPKENKKEELKKEEKVEETPIEEKTLEKKEEVKTITT